jgi:hypothetical protein
MRFSTFASLAGLATLAVANPDLYFTSIECASGEGEAVSTTTETVTVTAGAAGTNTGVASNPAVTLSNPSGAAATTAWSTKDGIVSSVDYSDLTTSTFLPSAGVYRHPQLTKELITVGKPTWTTVRDQDFSSKIAKMLTYLSTHFPFQRYTRILLESPVTSPKPST